MNGRSTPVAEALGSLARRLVCDGRGILAIDESTKTCNQRFAELGIPQTVDARRAYRELLITAPGIERSISGMILYDETIRQSTSDGTRFVDVLRSRGMLAGIKVDTGTAPLAFAPGETITEGIDGLRARLEEYVTLGADFTKWRAVFRIGAHTPTDRAITANAHALARYAALAQEAGLVPIVEPEVLADGDHDLARCADVSEHVLREVFAELTHAGVHLDAIVLKPNMITPGLGAPVGADADEVAAATLDVLGSSVPREVPGIAFLSGGMDDLAATERLDAMNRASLGRRPWALTFSFGRALQQGALHAWRGRPHMVGEAQRILVHRAACNSAAACGEYRADLEQLTPVERGA